MLPNHTTNYYVPTTPRTVPGTGTCWPAGTVLYVAPSAHRLIGAVSAVTVTSCPEHRRAPFWLFGGHRDITHLTSRHHGVLFISIEFLNAGFSLASALPVDLCAVVPGTCYLSQSVSSPLLFTTFRMDEPFFVA